MNRVLRGSRLPLTWQLFLCRSSCGTCEGQKLCRSTKGITMSTPTSPSTSVSEKDFCWQVGQEVRVWGKVLTFTSLTAVLAPAVGQDCYTRVWSLRDGHLLRTIPSPHPAANDMIPSIVFSPNLGGAGGLPGLLLAVKHDLYYYPYNTDYPTGRPADARQEGGATV